MDKIKPLNEFIKLYRDHLIAAGKAWDPLRTCLRDILEFHQVVEQRDLRKVDRRQVERYLKEIRGKYGPEAAGRKEKVVREFYELLRQEKLAGSNPFRVVSRKKKGDRHA